MPLIGKGKLAAQLYRRISQSDTVVQRRPSGQTASSV